MKGIQMQIKKAVLLSFISCTLTAGLYAGQNNYTNSEIYTQMCSKCHGSKAEGNPKKKGPALNNKLAYDIELELIEINDAEMNQSSGTDHDVMEHNQKKILEKGMKYDLKEMAKYIESQFYKK
jgi:cytochrome c553